LLGYAPTVLATRVVAPAVATLILTGQAPTANLTHSAAPAAAGLVLTGQSPTAGTGSGDIVSPPATTLHLTTFTGLELFGYPPTVTVTRDHVRIPATGSLVLAGQVTISDLVVEPPAGALDILGYSFTANSAAPIVRLVGNAALTLTPTTPIRPVGLLLRGHVPNLAFSKPSPSAATRRLNGKAPTLINTSPLNRTIPTFIRLAELDGSNVALEVSATTSGASLRLDTWAPTSIASSPVFFPPSAALTVASFGLGTNHVALPAVRALTLTGYALTDVGNTIRLPAAGAASLTGNSFVFVSNTQLMLPPVGALALASGGTSVGRSITPEARARRLNGKTPTAVVRLSYVVTPAAATLSLATGAPVGNVGNSTQPGATALVLTSQDVTAITELDVFVSPGSRDLTLIPYAPTDKVSGSIDVDRKRLILARFAPTLVHEVVTWDGARCRLINLSNRHKIRVLRGD